MLMLADEPSEVVESSSMQASSHGCGATSLEQNSNNDDSSFAKQG